MNREPPRLSHRADRFGSGAPSLLTKIIAAIAGLALLGIAVAVSLVVFAVAAAGLLVFGLYVWWKTRDLRRQMRAQFSDANVRRSGDAVEGEVIEGEVIREARPVQRNESNAQQHERTPGLDNAPRGD